MGKLVSKKQLGALVVALVVAATGLAAWIAQLTMGLLATTNLSNVFCWGLLIGMFAFCVGFGAGGQLAASYIVLSKRSELQRFALPAQAAGLGGAIGASVAIIADLGSPQNILAMILHLNVASPLAWDMMALTFFIAASVVGLVALARSWRSARAWMIAGIVAAVLLQVIEGVLFALPSARAWWHSVIVPIDFLAVAVVCGLALVLAMAAVSARDDDAEGASAAARRFGRMLAVAIVVHVALALAELVLLALEGTAAGQATLAAVGAYAPLYAAELGLPLVAAVLLLVRGGKAGVGELGAYAALAIVGMFAHRLMLLYPAFAAPTLFAGLSNQASPAWAYPMSTGLYASSGDAFAMSQAYLPSPVEWASILLPIGCAVAAALLALVAAKTLRK
ncbi:MAG TPA: polysulfide reductase NrfD [Candidatus Aphodovivens avistercoris]|nr:polysulfide reductase NrfD [Candidatus Aphodovivens avistercoris]